MPEITRQRQELRDLRRTDLMTPAELRARQRAVMPPIEDVRRWIALLEKQQGHKLDPKEARELEKLEAGKTAGVKRRVVLQGQRMGWLQ